MSDKVKKRKKWPWILLTIILLVIVLPISLVYILFYDGTHVENKSDDKLKTRINNMVSESFLYAKDTTDPRIEFSINEEITNSLLSTVFNYLPTEVDKYIPSVYAKLEDDKCVFYIEARVPLFKTRLVLSTSVNSNDEGKIIFKINDMIIGRVGGFSSISFSILNRILTEEELNKTFKDSGYSLICSYEEKTITYSYIDLFNDFKKVIDNYNNDDLLFSILNFLVKENCFELKTSNSKISLSTPLKPLHYSSNTIYPSRNNSLLDFDTIYPSLKVDGFIQVLEEQLNSDSLDSAYTQRVFKYLLNGVEALDEETKTYLSSYDLSSFGISDYETYKGLEYGDKNSIKNALISSFNTNINNDPASFITNTEGVLGNLLEEEITPSLLSKTIIGGSYIFDNTDLENKHHLSYIYVNDLVCNVDKDHVYIDLYLNINGYQITLTFISKASVDTSNKYTINFEIVKSYLGSKELNTELLIVFLNLLKKAETETVSISTNGFSFNLRPVIDSVGNPLVKAALLSDSYSIDIELEGDSILSNKDSSPVAQMKVLYKKNS